MGFIWEIKVKGFGPFANEAGGTLNLSKSRTAVYAGNGQGKSCISRLFRAAEAGTPSLRASSITRGMRSGKFEFAIKTAEKPDLILNISMTTNGITKVVNGTDYIFHVFNSDYIFNLRGLTLQGFRGDKMHWRGARTILGAVYMTSLLRSWRDVWYVALWLPQIDRSVYDTLARS